MIAKKTTKNQITLPKKVVERFPGATYFEVSVEGDAIVLRAVETGRAARVRAKLAALGIEEDDVQEAVRWARSQAR